MSLLLFCGVALGCLGCDQLTKGIARSRLGTGPPRSLAFGTVELMLAENPGAFLSFGSAMPEPLRRFAFQVGAPLALLALSIAFLRRPARSFLGPLGLALLVGGGFGNWLDRLLHDGAVTDFVRLGAGPLRTGVFNAADVAIAVGVGLLVAGTRRAPARHRA